MGRVNDDNAAAPAAPPIPDPSAPLHGLRLRSWRADDERDLAAVLEGATDPDFRHWNTPLRPIDDRAEAEQYIRRRAEGRAAGISVAFCVTGEGDDIPLGHISLGQIDRALRRGRVGYWVLPRARGRGVATRALDLLSRWAFTELGLHRVELGHAVGNDASCTVAERGGFPYEGTLRGAMFAAGRRDAFRDIHAHARLATDPAPTLPPGPASEAARGLT
jgi:RimJ/RimL family protein N-acetyltransferase